MTLDLQKINAIICENCIEDAINALSHHIANHGDDDVALYERGKLYWRIGDRRRAIIDYNAAVAVNPDSPARRALEMSTDIMNFFNPDLLNP